jgi:parallel beta-helix repeat protein
MMSAIAALFVVVQFASRPACGFTPPPQYGDWVVNDTTNWDSGTVLRGNIKIESAGVLILNGANITLDCAQKCQYMIDVQNGGTILATNTVFSAAKADYPYMFKIKTGANVLLDRCTIRDVGAFSSSMDSWGLYVHSSNTTITNCKITRCNVGLMVHGYVTPTISGNNISGNSDRGIWCKYSSPMISNNRISGNGYGIFLENDSMPSILNNEFSDNEKDALSMTAGCLAEWTISQPCRWVNSTMTLRGNLSVFSGGTLWLQGCTLGMATVHGGLTVGAGGDLRLTGSSLAAAGGSDAYYLTVGTGGNLTVDSSVIKNAGWPGANASRSGVHIAGQGRITGSNLAWNNASLVCVRSQISVVNTTLGGSSMDIVMDNSSVRFVNVSFNPSKVIMTGESSVLEVGWHLSAGAVWQNGRGLNGASLTVKYLTGAAIYDGSPVDGWVRSLVVIGRRITPVGTTDTANVSILAKRTGFDDVSRTVQLTADRDEMMVFTDISAPSVSISYPAPGFATNRTTVQFRGNASDNIPLDSADYSLDDFPRWTPLNGNISQYHLITEWTFALVNLTRGNHRLSVRAVDMAGLASFSNMSFLVDTEAPELELDDPYDEYILVNRTGVRFRGTTETGAGLQIAGADVAVAADGTFDFTVNLTEGQTAVSVVSRDRAGNAVSIVRMVTVDITPPPVIITSPPEGFRTKQAEMAISGRIEPGAKFRVDGSTVELSPDGTFTHTVILSGGPKSIELYAEDPAGNVNVTVFTLTRQLEPAGNGSSFLERYGLYLMAGVVAIAVLAVVAGAGLWWRKGKKGTARPGKGGTSATTPEPQAGPAAETGDSRSVDELLYGGKKAQPPQDEAVEVLDMDK